jgi:DNA-binding Lrp family transcriptional regulator
MQKYLVLIKIRIGKGGEFWKGFSNMPDQPMKGVAIEEAYSLFGYWDFALIVKADSNDNILHFVGEKLRAIEGIAKTSTTPLTVLKEYKKH